MADMDSSPTPPGPIRPILPSSPRQRLRRVVHGPLPRLPGPLDSLSESWWRLPPRARLLATGVVVLLVMLGLAARSATSPWGRATTVVVARDPVRPGERLATTTTSWPADLVPPDALTATVTGIATRPVRAGEVLTRSHLATDLSHLLADDEVAVAVQAAPSGLPPHATLDLLGTDFDGTGHRLGRGRLLAADDESTWVAVDRAIAPAVAAALSTGQVTIALAPDD